MPTCEACVVRPCQRESNIDNPQSSSGLLNLHKPSGVTSRDVVNRVQRLVRPVKVGHAGTLDPLASGVLIVAIASATRLVEYVQQMPKSYRGTFLLGRTSTTEDVEGEVTTLPDARRPTLDELSAAARGLTGEIQQRPPAYSALKVAGRRAYDLARRGQEVDLAPRPVRIDRLEIVRYEYPELELEVECSSGTYLRSLGRDLAVAVGNGAVMSALVRTAIGPFTLEQAIAPEALTAESLPTHLLPSVLGIRGLMDEQVVDDEQCRRLAQGLAIELPGLAGEEVAAIDARGRLAAVMCPVKPGLWRAAKNLR